MRKALITGCAGQDGSYLSELLIDQGYEVDGLVRPSGDDRLQRLSNVLPLPSFNILWGDVIDLSLPIDLVQEGYDEIYHLAGYTHVAQSYDYPVNVTDVNTNPAIRFLQAIHRYAPKTKFYFAGSSEMFGEILFGEKADENQPLGAHSPYAISKIAAHLMCRIYRKRGLFVVGGIGFNHESHRRGERFVTRKLGKGIRRFKKTKEKVQLGNVHSMRDWHHAEDTVTGMFLAMQHSEPDEYVFASGKAHSVEWLAHLICRHFKVEFEDAIEVSEMEQRPWDIQHLCGNPHKAEKVLGWERRFSFEDLVEDVCRA